MSSMCSGLAGNSRLKAWLAPEMMTAKRKIQKDRQGRRASSRTFAYRTRKKLELQNDG